MAKYMYVLAVSKQLNDIDFTTLKRELCRIFHTQDVMILNEKEFRVVSGLSPLEVDEGLRGLSAKYGALGLRAGSKLE
jgi:hypothetical protein